jgi:hypothetical protein
MPTHLDDRERRRRSDGTTSSPGRAGLTPGKRSRVAGRYAGVQPRAAGPQALAPAEVQREAAAGVSGPASSLPHAERIQAAFGAHDIGGIGAHLDAGAGAACESIGARAYATGEDVAFAGSPDLHTAAHEAAHVVQQRAGVSLAGGVGREGDTYERHADVVADLVYRGHSAEAELDRLAGPGGSSAVQRAPAVQRLDEACVPDEMGECPDVDDEGPIEIEPVVLEEMGLFVSSVGGVLDWALPNPGGAVEMECQLRVPLYWGGVWALGALKVEASRDGDGYTATMQGDVGLSLSPSGGIFFDLSERKVVEGKGETPERAATMLSLGLELIIRSIPAAGDELADLLWGDNNAGAVVSELLDSDSVAVTKTGRLGMEVDDPAAGVKGSAGVGIREELTRAGGHQHSNRFQFKGEIAVDPLAGELDMDYQIPKQPEPEGTIKLALKGNAGADPALWINLAAQAIGLAVTVAGDAEAGDSWTADAAAALSGVEGSIGGGLRETLSQDAIANLGGHAQIEVSIEHDAATKEVTLVVHSVAGGEMTEPRTGGKVAVTQKQEVIPPVVIATTP